MIMFSSSSVGYYHSLGYLNDRHKNSQELSSAFKSRTGMVLPSISSNQLFLIVGVGEILPPKKNTSVVMWQAPSISKDFFSSSCLYLETT